MVVVVRAMTHPAELMIAFTANHMRASSILLNKHSTFRTGYSKQHFRKVAPCLRAPDRRSFAEYSFSLIPTCVLGGIFPLHPTALAAELIIAWLLKYDTCVETMTVRTRYNVGGVMDVFTHILRFDLILQSWKRDDGN